MFTKGRTSKDSQHEHDCFKQLTSFFSPFVANVIRPKMTAEKTESLSSEEIDARRDLIKRLSDMTDDTATKNALAGFNDQIEADDKRRSHDVIAPNADGSYVAHVIALETDILTRAWMNALCRACKRNGFDIAKLSASLDDRMLPTDEGLDRFERSIVNSETEHLNLSDALMILDEARRALPDGQPLPQAAADYLIALA